MVMRYGTSSPESGTSRFQVELSRGKAARIERLMQECGIETKKELFNNALTLLDWAVKEVRKGHSIASVDEQNKRYQELQMPILTEARERAKEAVTERG